MCGNAAGADITPVQSSGVIEPVQLTAVEGYGEETGVTGEMKNGYDPAETGYDFIENGIYYKIIDSTKKYVTTSEGDKPYTGKVVIPDEVTHDGVTYRITKVSGFAHSPGVTEVTIPRYTETISGFYGGYSHWVNLPGIKAPARTPRHASTAQSSLHTVRFNAIDCKKAHYKKYDSNLLGGSCGGEVVVFPPSVTSFIFGDEVQTIPEGLLNRGEKITSLKFPKSVITIDEGIIAKDFDHLEDMTLECARLDRCGWLPVNLSVVSRGKEFASWPDCTVHPYYTDEEETSRIRAYFGIPDKEVSSVTIPSWVKRIGSNCFFGYHNLTSVVFPEGLEEIGSDAFENSALKSIKINCKTLRLAANSLNYLTDFALTAETLIVEPYSVGNVKNLELHCDHLVREGPVTWGNNPFGKVDDCLWDIPETGEYFYFFGEIKNLTFGPTVTVIGDNSFSGCSSLTSVKMPAVRTIGERAFKRCRALTHVEIPFVQKIGKDAFHECASLTHIDFPETLITIDMGAFAGCKALADLTFPSSLRTIAGGAFNDCESLQEIELPVSLQSIKWPFMRSGIRKATVHMRNFDVCTFTDCPNLTSLELCEEVCSVDGCIDNSPNLKSFVLTHDIKGWMQLSNVETLVIGDDVTELSERLFYGTPVKNITWGKNLSEISFQALQHAEIDEVILPASLTWIAYDGIGLEKTSRVVFTSQRCRGQIKSNNNGNITVEIPEHVKQFPWIYLPETNNATLIMEATELDINDNPSGMNFADIKIGDRVTHIPINFMRGNTNLRNITLPPSVKTVGAGIFQDCTNLEEIECQTPTPPVLLDAAMFDYIADSETYARAILYVPAGSGEAYRNADGWKKFQNIVEKEIYQGVEDVAAQAQTPFTVMDNMLVISNTDVKVFTLDGRAAVTAPGRHMLNQGVYIVTCPDQPSQKVIIR